MHCSITGHDPLILINFSDKSNNAANALMVDWSI